MDQRLLAAPHGFSQRATSFIASWCQGIHRTPFSCSQLRECQTEVQHSHLAQEPSNLLAKVRPIPIHMPPHADQLREQPTSRDGRAIKHIHSLHASEHLRLRGLGSLSRSSSGQTCNRRVQTRQTLIHMSKEQKTNLPTKTQSAPVRPSPGHLSRGSAQCSYDLLSHRDGVSPTGAKLLMEVDGIEPTTPCLQSRCSPTELHPQETQTDRRKRFFL